MDPAEAKIRRDKGEAELRKVYVEAFGERSDNRKDEAVLGYQKTLEEREYANGGKLRDYQAEGVSWLVSNYVNKRSSILADEMGKGIINSLLAANQVIVRS